MTLHIVHFMRSINPDTLAGLQNTVLSALQNKATEISIHISSDGGLLDQGFTAHHFLRSLPVPLTMHCIGNVESIAILMYLAGTNRLMVPHGKVKIHPMHWGFPGGTVDHDRLAEYVASLDFDAQRYADIFAERTQKAAEIFDVRAHLAGKAEVLDATSAVKFGIATGIADAKFPEDAVNWWV